MKLAGEYQALHEAFLEPVAARLRHHLEDCVQGLKCIDHISTRAKSIDSFLKKAAKYVEGAPKYSEPLRQIQDQVGARIVGRYVRDLEPICRVVERYFHPIEIQRIVQEEPSRFGYEGKHYVLLLPKDVLPEGPHPEAAPDFFELQVKTLFQHAWAEAGHDLGYKAETSLTSMQERCFAFAAAQAWGADYHFDQLAAELKPAVKE